MIHWARLNWAQLTGLELGSSIVTSKSFQGTLKNSHPLLPTPTEFAFLRMADPQSSMTSIDHSDQHSPKQQVTEQSNALAQPAQQSIRPAKQPLGLTAKVIGMAIATSTLPVLFLGLTLYATVHLPIVAPWVGIHLRPPHPDALAQLHQFSILALGGALVTATSVSVFAAYWFQRILQPLSDSIAIAQDMSAGNLDMRLATEGTDELATLGLSINQMAQQITDLLQERDQQTQTLQNMNGALEERVHQRTSQLYSVIKQLKQEIWERKQAEIALQHSQSKLIHSEKMSGLGQMVAGIAHEINNPINFIHGNLKHVQQHVQEILSILEAYQTLYPDPTPELKAIADDLDIDFLERDVRKIVSSMQVGTNRILGIVRSLQTFSRLDQAEFKLADIHQGIDSTLLILKHRLKAHPGRPQVVIVKQYSDLPFIECQAGQLNQVFMNILANALDALDEAGDLCSKKSEPPMIIISTRLIDSDRVAIQISDNGPGIPIEVQNRLFDPFFTTKPVGKGTGLGMSISYTIITETHGGMLQLISTSGKGASFLIELPIKQPPTTSKLTAASLSR